jgi:hypothetical protein
MSFHLFRSRVARKLTCVLRRFVQDFADEKRKEMERDAPREEDITLPGWVRPVFRSYPLQPVLKLTRLSPAGRLGRQRREKVEERSQVCQEDRRRRRCPTQGRQAQSRDNQRAQGQEGGQVHAQGLAVPVHECCPARAQAAHADGPRVVYLHSESRSASRGQLFTRTALPSLWQQRHNAPIANWGTCTNLLQILRDQTIPAVLVKPGVAIRPVDRKA